MVVPEYHVYIIDPQKRDLNLVDITKEIRNWHTFGEWKNGKCYGGWNMLNHNKMLCLLSKYDLYMSSDADDNTEPQKIIWIGPKPDETCSIL